MAKVNKLPKRSRLSRGEETFARDLRALGLEQPIREYRFFDARGWRFDFAWPELKIAVEIEGAVGWGRHTQKAGFTNDCDKYNQAALMGWHVFRFTSKMAIDGRAVNRMGAILDTRLSGKVSVSSSMIKDL